MRFVRGAISYICAAAIIGLAAGLGGTALALLLHWTQHLAYGYSLGAVISPESFLEGVSDANPERRLQVLVLCGLVAGGGWFALSKIGRPLISVANAIKSPLVPMPILETLVHAILQIVTVALGSPLGREVAPRELGALFAQRLSNAFGVLQEDRQLLLACGAGAGLAAVYGVPIAATIFVSEVLVRRFTMVSVATAMMSCFIASYVSGLELGDDLQYHIPAYALSLPLVLWSLVLGPLFGLAGYCFRSWTTRARKMAATGRWVILCCPIAFSVIGVMSLALPQLPGNGKGPAELAFSDTLSWKLASTLLLAKLIGITIVLRAGARGGLLTPGFSAGALLAVVIGGVWNEFLPVVPLGAVAVVGAGAFLASSMSMPLSAVVLTMEFVNAPPPLVIPVALATGTATATRLLLAKGLGRSKTHEVASMGIHHDS